MNTINITIDLDEYIADAANDMGEYGEKPQPISKYIVKEIIRELTAQIDSDQRNRIQQEVAEKFEESVTVAVQEAVDKRLESFMQNEIALTDHWNRPNFIGTFDDFMAKTFDDKFLAPVDSSGKVIKGCTSTGLTYVEWLVKNRIAKLEETIMYVVNNKAEKVEKMVKSEVDAKLQKCKEEAAARVLAALDK
ncbi:MAG: hypothetical protein RR609_06665 [Aurantimicrobium sp.]